MKIGIGIGLDYFKPLINTGTAFAEDTEWDSDSDNPTFDDDENSLINSTD